MKMNELCTDSRVSNESALSVRSAAECLYMQKRSDKTDCILDKTLRVLTV